MAIQIICDTFFGLLKTPFPFCYLATLLQPLPSQECHVIFDWSIKLHRDTRFQHAFSFYTKCTLKMRVKTQLTSECKVKSFKANTLLRGGGQKAKIQTRTLRPTDTERGSLGQIEIWALRSNILTLDTWHPTPQV